MNRCPACGEQVTWEYTCHTWQNHSGMWMACMQCDSAVDYSCTACDWYYTHGLNSGNPRSAKNEAKRPDWLPADGPDWGKSGMANIPEGVIHREDWSSNDAS